MASVPLTRGAIAAISEGGEMEEGLKPTLQVVDVRLVNSSQTAAERYRMLLSDGEHQQQAMLATQMNDLVRSGDLQKGSIVRLEEFICNTIQNRRIIIIIKIEVLVSRSDFIGEPKNYESGFAAPQSVKLAQSSAMDQPSAAAERPQSYGGSYARNTGAVNSLPPKSDPRGGNSADANRNGGNQRNFADANMNGGNQNQRFSNPSPGAGYRPPANTYGRAGQPTYQQSLPSYTNRGPIAKNEAPARIIPISALNPYQGRWTVKARVTAKSAIRRYNNTKGDGKVFSFDLLDSEGGEIRVTCFNLVADQFYDQIEEGNVYLISKGSLKPAQKSFNHLNNDYEIFFDSTSTIQPCTEEDKSIPRQQFNFRSISEVEGMENNSTVDLIGIVTSINPASTIMRKNGTETQKRTLQLKDTSGRSVELTIWGNFCNNEGQQLQTLCDSGSFPVLGVKAGRVNDFNGKSVGTIGSSQLFIDPDFPEAHRLKEWYNREGKSLAAPSLSRDSSTMGRTDVRKTVTQIKNEGLGRSEKPDWITVHATISFIKVDNFCYTACPLMVGDRQCNKKVTNNGDGSWRCDRCDQCFPTCDYRYLLNLQVQDHTGITWVTAFQESGEEIMGVPAKELYLLKFEEQDDVKFAEIIQNVLFNQFLFKLKIKEETFADEPRLKSTVVKAEKVNPSSESRYLLGLIEKLSMEHVNAIPGMHGAFMSGSGMSNAGYGNMESKPFPVTNNFGGNNSANRYRTEPINQTGRHVNEYGGITNHNMSTRGTQAFCNNCGSTGHSIHNCPRGFDRQGQSFGGGYPTKPSNSAIGGGGDACFKCQQPGHWARDCPGQNAATSAYGSSNISGRYANQHVGGF